MPSRDVNVESQSKELPFSFLVHRGNMPFLPHISLTMASHMTCLLLAEWRVWSPCVWKEEENYNMDECLNNITTHKHSLTLGLWPILSLVTGTLQSTLMLPFHLNSFFSFRCSHLGVPLKTLLALTLTYNHYHLNPDRMSLQCVPVTPNNFKGTRSDRWVVLQAL